MPELGKGVYQLVFDTAQVAKMETAEKTVMSTTAGMDEAVTGLDASVLRLSEQVGIMSGRVTTGFATAGSGAKAGAAEVTAAADEAATASTKMGVAAEASAGKAGAAFYRFGKVGKGGLGLLGLGALYFTIKSGIGWINATTQATAQLRNVIQSTNGVAGVSVQHAQDLATHWEDVAGAEKGATEGMMAMLLSFRNIRNEGTGAAAIYDRTVQAIENISVRTGKGVKQVSVAVGKAINDPVKYMSSLARTGVTFSKQQQDMVKALVNSGKPLQAQEFLLKTLEQRYGGARGAAYAFGQTAAGQFDIAKNKLAAASAQIITAFLPVFMQLTQAIVKVAQLMGHHAQVVKDLALAFIGLKVAAIAFRVVMDGMNVLKWIANLFRLGTATKAVGTASTVAAEETVAADGTMVVANEAATASVVSMGAAWPLMAVAAVAAIALVALHVTGLYKKIRGGLADLVLGATHAPGTPGGSSSARQAELVNRIRARYQTLKQSGMSKADILKAIQNQNPNLTAHDILVYTRNGTAGPSATPTGAKAKKLSGNDFSNTNPAAKGAGLLPYDYQIAEARAALTKGNADDIKALKNEEGYLYKLLQNHKLSKAKQLAILQELDRVTSSLSTFVTKAKKGQYKGLLPLPMELAYQRALRTKTLKDDEKVLKEEESFLTKLIASHKLHGAKLLAASKQLTSVKKKLAADMKTEADKRNKLYSEMQAFRDEKGSFFSEFSSSIFHQGAAGMEMGAGGTTNKSVTQNNTFNEMPKDRFAIGRRMTHAAAAAG